MEIKCKEEQDIAEAIVAARKMQEVLWGEYNSKYNIPSNLPQYSEPIKS